jgi:hypothetical protein
MICAGSATPAPNHPPGDRSHHSEPHFVVEVVRWQPIAMGQAGKQVKKVPYAAPHHATSTFPEPAVHIDFPPQVVAGREPVE